MDNHIAKIEEIVTQKYLNDAMLPKHKQLDDNAFLDWALFGAKQMQRLLNESPKLKNIFSVEDFKTLGFELSDANEIDNGTSFYEVYTYERDNIRIDITCEFDNSGKAIKNYVELENILLKGLNVSGQTIKQLLELIFGNDENRNKTKS